MHAEGGEDIPLTTAIPVEIVVAIYERPFSARRPYPIDPFQLDTPEQYQDTSFQLGDEQLTHTSVVGGWWFVLDGGKEVAVNPAEDIRLICHRPKTFPLTVHKRCFNDSVIRFNHLHPDKVIPSTAPVNANIEHIAYA